MAPRFKKLTDCPENLREAIDWLIQVRHGGDGKGLEKLAEALKKLIDEVIDKAYTTNVDALLKVLNSAKSYNCCKHKVTKIEELKDSKMPGQNMFKDLKTYCESIKDCPKYHIDSSQQKAYEEIQSKLEELEKLKESLTGLTDNNNCETLLKHLCTGLQKFLGFNPASKGYDGTGIVYSDLDRLCDAVMGFLYGVLKDVSEKQPYKVGRDILETLVRDVKTKLSSGREGFSVIATVTEKVREYNESVKESNEKVKEPIKKLLKHTTDNLSKTMLDEIEVDKVTDDPGLGKQYHSANRLLDDCLGQGDIYIAGMMGAKKNVEDLNSSLRDRVKNAKKSVIHEHRRLKKLSDKEKKNLEEMTEKIWSVLEALGESVKNNICDEVKRLVHHLILKVRDILGYLREVDRKLRDYVQKLGTWIHEADGVVIKAEQKIEEILDEVDNQNKQEKKKAIKIASAEIKGYAMTLHEQFEELNKKYAALVTKIKGSDGSGNISGVVKDLKGVRPKVQEPTEFKIFNKKGTDNIWDASEKIQLLTKKVKQNVGNYLENLKGAFTAGIATATTGPTRDNIPGLDAFIRAISGNFKKLGAQLEVAKQDPLLSVQIEKLLRYLKDGEAHWNNLTSQHTDKIVANLKEDLETHAITIDGELGALLNAAAVSGVKNLQTEVTKIVSEHLEPITNEANELIQKAKTTKSTIHKKAEEVKLQLESLCNEIKNIAEGSEETAKSQLTELRRKIGVTVKGDRNSLHKLRGQLHMLQSKTLANVIEETEAFTSASEELRDSTIESLKKYVTSHISSALSTLTTAARRNYVTSVKQLLTAFADKVSQELAPLPDLIDKDRREGFKGFMRTLQGKIEDNGGTSEENIEKLSGLVNEQIGDSVNHKTVLENLSNKFKEFYIHIHTYVKTQLIPNPVVQNSSNHTSNNGLPPPGRVGYSGPVATSTTSAPKDPIAEQLDILNYYVKGLFGTLSAGYFGISFATKLDDFVMFLNSMRPSNFAGIGSPLFDILSRSIRSLLTELGKAYISTYDTAAYTFNWDVNDRNCAKVFLTSIEILVHDLKELHDKCGENGVWKKETICVLSGSNSYNDLGLCLERFGYGVPSKDGKQDNELQCKSNMNGNEIFTKLVQHTVTVRDDYTLMSTMEKLSDCLATYYRVCHLPTTSSTKYPSSVYQMLTWLSGLAHNPVHDKLYLDGFADLFEKKDKEAGDGKGDVITIDVDSYLTDGSSISTKTSDIMLQAHPETITPAGLSDILTEVCSCAHDVLTSILGHGHSGGRYAVDFNTNPDKFSYPSDMVTLVCWILDIIKRVYHQLYFLYRQCYITTDRNGWRDCYYGRHIGGSSWVCNQMQCPDQTCEQKCKQTCNRKHKQKGDQHPNCGLKSPLQSFLEDGLQGFLPHHVKFERGKLECSVKGHFSLPCKTPMGFADIGEMASHTHKGWNIYVALARICGDESSPLSKLCGQLSCLLPSAPKTLDDMFGFYYNLLNDWNDKRTIGKRAEQREAAYRTAVQAANFGNANTTLDINPIFRGCEHSSDRHMQHIKGDLNSLVNCDFNDTSNPAHPCGPYLRPICRDMCNTFTKDNADKYVSWVVYCTESFLYLLEQLYAECCANCDSKTSKCRTSKCDAICVTTNPPMAPDYTHKESCSSIVHCRFMRPTLYKYGLVHNNIKALDGVSSKRTCKDFCDALEKVINKEVRLGRALAVLVYRTIPKFLWTIRYPFFWTTVGLWLLSLLYLLHIMVIRLDLLHIKSHLHSPSSHRIAAQSLLAAARVKALNKVLYLQP